MRKNERTKKQSSSGITLIALVITIIVLLILAGVSISLVVGNNGVINQAQEAGEKTNEASRNEEIELGLLATEADLWIKNGNGDYETTLKENLKGEVKNFVEKDDGTKKFTYIPEGSTEEQKFIINTDGTIMEDILANKIMVTNYGEKVNYNPTAASEVSLASDDTMEWRIFYTEGDNVFIIASDYLPNSSINVEATQMITKSTYNVEWSDKTTDFQPMGSLSLFKATGYQLQSKFGASRFASTLLNTNNWVNFVDSSKASYAIGAPTLEMWLASWNDRYSDSLSFEVQERGYLLKSNKTATAEQIISLKEKTGFINKDPLYFPNADALRDNCYGYWLAAPSHNAQGSNAMMNVECAGPDQGKIGWSGFVEYCARPVVCLNKKTTGEYNEQDQIWILE